ncbi:hypothetical protein F5B22DRAFT_304790 [Xylaria bambusicola]|uniref:uncharacterized protein n=1 Tax=Xylaria bambusicola TaxID=326684 RepID=UPI002008D017|nr:uncharacterized protein F5B22DRAFT_304790 [Xylaria bambusicola]KAI0512487.1 hypothetical protein F5B22DRAFT_304790 [Xylaria bambusicola]
MSQKKRVSSRHNDTTRRRKLSPHLQVWFCYECQFGPMNDALDEICVNCGKRRCSRSKAEWVPVGGKPLLDIPVPGFQQYEALPKASHVIPHNYYDCSHRAATPLDHAGSAISSNELAFSPLPLNQPYLVGTGTSIGTSTQSETSTQQSSDLALGKWNLGLGLVPIPFHEPFHGSLSSAEVAYNDARPHLPTNSPQIPSPLCQLTTVQHASKASCSVVDTQYHSVESKGELKRKYVDSATTATGSRDQTAAQIYTVPILPDGTISGSFSTEWSEIPDNTSIRSRGGCPALSHIPSPSTKSKKSISSSSEQRLTAKGVSRHHECCKSDGTQRLACPFYKYDPKRYFACVLKGFDSVGHLGQHLKNKHKLGPIHCNLCWLTFDTAMSLAHHAQYCKLPTGGVPVNRLPVFPRMRLSREKKWYWGWKKLFGEGAAPPPCPFSHPEQDFGSQVQAQNPGLPNQLIRREFMNERPSYVNFTEEEECSNSSKSPDRRFAEDDNLLTMAEHITNRLPNNFSLFSDTSPPDSMWNLGFENF